MGLVFLELSLLFQTINCNWNRKLDLLPDAIKAAPFWQYGRGEHRSEHKRIIGSIAIQLTSDQGTPMNIRHHVIKGSSPWVIGNNGTKHCKIMHRNGNYLRFGDDKTLDTDQLTDHNDHSYINVNRFYIESSVSVQHPSVLSMCASSANLTFGEHKKIFDRVHKHVCGHSNFEDISLLLKRNHIWSDDIAHYLGQIFDTCPDCTIVKQPLGMRPVSHSRMSRDLNDVVCLDHLHLEDLTVFHIMDSATTYSTGSVVSNKTPATAIKELESAWFWSPHTIVGHTAFDCDEFKTHLAEHNVKLRRVSRQRHNKNAIESKHNIIRNVFLRLQSACPDKDKGLLGIQAIRASNALYRNNVASAK